MEYAGFRVKEPEILEPRCRKPFRLQRWDMNVHNIGFQGLGFRVSGFRI